MQRTGGVQMGEGAWGLRTERQRGVRRHLCIIPVFSIKIRFFTITKRFIDVHGLGSAAFYVKWTAHVRKKTIFSFDMRG